MMSTEQRGYASVQEHKSDMSDSSVFARSFAIFWAFAAGGCDVAMRYVDGYDQLTGTKFVDWYAHWRGDS